MSADSAHLQREWYIEVSGQRTGPFAADAVRDLFLEGEILGEQRLHAADGSGAMLSVKQLNELFEQSPTLSSGSPTSVPVRPAEIGKGSSDPSLLQDDPSVGLFDTLMAAKDRKSPKSEPASTPSVQSPSALGNLNYLRLVATAAGLLAIYALYSLATMLQNGGKQLEIAASGTPSDSHVSTVQGAPEGSAPNAATTGQSPRFTPHKLPPVRATVPQKSDKKDSASDEREHEKERDERDRDKERDRDRDRENQDREKDHDRFRNRDEAPSAAEGGAPGPDVAPQPYSAPSAAPPADEAPRGGE